MPTHTAIRHNYHFTYNVLYIILLLYRIIRYIFFKRTPIYYIIIIFIQLSSLISWYYSTGVERTVGTHNNLYDVYGNFYYKKKYLLKLVKIILYIFSKRVRNSLVAKLIFIKQ